MDTHINGTPGLGLPPPSADQPIAGVTQGQPVQDYAADNATNDLDQEWVGKAKAIVDKTKDDPYLKSKELGRIKAEYLKNRYNKHIKVSED